MGQKQAALLAACNMNQKQVPAKIPSGEAFKEMSGFHRGETPEAQADSYNTGPSAMSISAKHNSNPSPNGQKAVDTEPMQSK